MCARAALVYMLAALILLVTQSFPLSADWKADEWQTLDSKEHKILFSPPFMGNWNPGITVMTRDRLGSKSEWMCWRDFESHGANACISYQTQKRSFPYFRASDILGYYDDFKRINYNITRESKKCRHNITKFDTVAFTYDLKGSTKICVGFVAAFNGGKRLIHGWYGAPVNKPLNDLVIEKMIGSIGLKGRSTS